MPYNIVRFDAVVLMINLTSLYFFKNIGDKRSLHPGSSESTKGSNKDQKKEEYEWKRRRRTTTKEKEK